MIDFIIGILAVLSVCVFLKRSIDEFKGKGSKTCAGSCGGCKFKDGCKGIKR